MSRSLLGFLLFCLLLGFATAGVVWYMGPTLAGIVADSERRQNSYYLLQLLPAGAARAGDGGAPSYRSRFVTQAADENARLLWQGGSVEVAEGSVLLDVAGVQLIEFATGADLVQLFTSTAYRELASAFPVSVRHLGTSSPPEALAGSAATVVVLYHVDPERSPTPLGVPGDSGWLALLPRYQGAVRWEAPIATVRGAGDWNRVLMIQFDTTARAEAWLEDPNTATERAIARRQVDDMLVLLVAPPNFASGQRSR